MPWFSSGIFQKLRGLGRWQPMTNSGLAVLGPRVGNDGRHHHADKTHAHDDDDFLSASARAGLGKRLDAVELGGEFALQGSGNFSLAGLMEQGISGMSVDIISQGLGCQIQQYGPGYTGGEVKFKKNRVETPESGNRSAASSP